MRGTPLHVCVVGGGFTGAAAAIACASRIEHPFRLTIVERGTSLGRGVAYGGDHPLHLLNIRTRDLSIRAGQPGDFLNWAFRQIDQGENHSSLHEGLAHTFLPRQLFGEYVRQRLSETIEKRPDIAFTILNAAATGLSAAPRRYRIELKGVEPVSADIVILATAYGPQAKSIRGALAPYERVSGERFVEASSIVLIGSGLSMVDVLLTARRDGFTKTANIISRRGQLPRIHAPKGVVPQQVGLPRSKRVASLVAAIRIACEAAEAHGTPWQAVINGLRPSLQRIWQELPVEEQARFLRHLRPYWDAHRHRLPIEVHGRIQSEFAEGRARLLQGRVVEVKRTAGGFIVTLKRPGGDYEKIETDLAFDCTGHRPDLAQPLIASVLDQGLAEADPHRLGLAVETDGRIKGDARSRGLFALGPLGQGSLWEITAVPEIVHQADDAARIIAEHANLDCNAILAC
ncbi:MAG TPA: FAD/NAD(P)-binding protein [Methyloceanibacter sp.]